MVAALRAVNRRTAPQCLSRSVSLSRFASLCLLGALILVPAAADAQDAPGDSTVAATPGATPRVDVSFHDAPLPQLVRLVARHCDRRFIVPSSLSDVRVNVISERPVSPAGLYQGFLAVLQMHGLTVVRQGRYERIVSVDGIEGHDVPVVTDADAADG